MARKQFFSKRGPRWVLWVWLLAGVTALGVIYRYRSSNAETAGPAANPPTPVAMTPPQQSAEMRTNMSVTTERVTRPTAAPAPLPPSPPPAPAPATTLPTEPAPEPTSTGDSPRSAARPAPEHAGAAAFAEGKTAYESRNYLTARRLLSQAVAAGLSDADDRTARRLLNECADQWLFGRGVLSADTLCEYYEVRRGDLLVQIGRRFNVPYQLIMRINGITRPESLQVGQRLKVVRGPFRLTVDRERCLMTVYLGDVIVRTYPVGLGATGRETPTGLWRAAAGRKQVNPAWTDPDTGQHYYADDPRNPLGARWIGLEGLDGDARGRQGFGIHGTIKPEEIGAAVSRGCIRLHNDNVVELYDMVTDGQTEVRVF